MSAALSALRRDPPRSLTPAIEKALGCEHYFTQRYLEPNPKTYTPSASGAFHSYRRTYIDHLLEMEMTSDPAWVREWIRTAKVPEDSVTMILNDAVQFRLRQDATYLHETIIGLDENFHVTEWRSPETRFHGLLDLVEIIGTSARVLSVRSGWSDANVRDYEAGHAAGLLFAAFPVLTDIDFSWSFPRAGADTVPIAYHRSIDYVWIQESMKRRYAAMLQVIHYYATGGPVSANATAGLCKHCTYSCPIRSAAERGLYIDKPLSNDLDAMDLARRVHSANLYVLQGRKLLESYLEEGGRLSLGNGVVAEMRAGAQTEYRLDKVLEVLGFDLPAHSREYDVPLESLKVGSTALKSFAKAKKRVGFGDRLTQIARSRPKFSLHIGKQGAEDDED